MRQLVEKHNLDNKLMATRKNLHPRCTDHEIRLALQLRAEGFSAGIIAVKFDVSERTVWRWLSGKGRVPKAVR